MRRAHASLPSHVVLDVCMKRQLCSHITRCYSMVSLAQPCRPACMGILGLQPMFATRDHHAGLLHGERFGGRPTPRRGRGYPPQDAHEGRAPVLRRAWTPHSHLLQAPRSGYRLRLGLLLGCSGAHGRCTRTCCKRPGGARAQQPPPGRSQSAALQSLGTPAACTPATLVVRIRTVAVLVQGSAVPGRHIPCGLLSQPAHIQARVCVAVSAGAFARALLAAIDRLQGRTVAMSSRAPEHRCISTCHIYEVTRSTPFAHNAPCGMSRRQVLQVLFVVLYFSRGDVRC